MTEPFTVYVVQSAHTDIGYTHPQEQIKLMYLDSYDRVLDLCRHTEQAPEAERFKWTCETSWQVRHYLAARPEREEEFLHFVRRGQIEVAAAYYHFTDLIDADAYRRSLDWVADYCARNDVPLRCAMHCDINGWPWAVADILAERSIPYFCSHVHVESGTDPLGRRGSVHYQWLLDGGIGLRPDAPIRIPRAFWWEGPAGGRVLHWLNEHYHLGNMLGLSSLHPFDADKTHYFAESDHMQAGELYARATVEVPRYLQRLRADGYPYNRLLATSGGFYIDNSPPDGRWLEVIARWNLEHTDIVLRSATLSEWFEAFDANEVSALPTYAVAWPDHWAHGIGSFTARTAQARRTQRRRADARALVAAAGSSSAKQYLAIAEEQERLALEHTFGAWSTASRPAASANAFQQSAKELTFHCAELYLDESVSAALRTIVPAGSRPQLFEWRGGYRQLHTLQFDPGDQRLDPAVQVLRASDGSIHPFQYDDANLCRFVAVAPPQTSQPAPFDLITRPATSAPIPARADTRVDTGNETLDQSPLVPALDTDATERGTYLATAGWQLEVDPVTGGLFSLRDRATGREWVDRTYTPGFGTLIHERIIHPLGRQAVGNAARFIALDVATDEARRAFPPGQVFERICPDAIRAPQREQGPVFDAIIWTGAHERIGPVRVAWRLYHALPLVELVVDWDKPWSDLPEAAYVAFPFAAAGGRLDLETGGAFFRPGSHATGGRLPGTCSSYYTVQRGAHMTTPDGGSLLWLPLDAPLVMPNQIKFDNWETGEWRWNGFLASMPVNHYWHTNFAMSQRGPLRLRYRIISVAGFPTVETAMHAAQPVEALGWR